MDEVAIRLRIVPLNEGGYVATSPDVPGLVAEGRSIVEATEIAQRIARQIAESCIDHGDPLPPALSALYDKRGRNGKSPKRSRAPKHRRQSMDLRVPVSVR